MRGIYSLFLVLFLIGLAWLGTYIAGFYWLFGIAVPYLAAVIFIFGFIYRIMKWARSPVPFNITTTCGQQNSLPWIKSDNLESPHNFWGVVGRMALELFFFRSLFRNSHTELKDDKLLYIGRKWLWLAALAFHGTLLLILFRHLRLFLEPVPSCINFVQNLDGLMQVGVPVFYMSDVIFLGAVFYLFLRRVAIPQVRYISLENDYFPLFLIISIGISGVIMRHIGGLKVDIINIKQLVIGLITFSPTIPDGIGSLFYLHLFLVSILFAYFPFSKLMHAGGIFLSPTRNMKANSREFRHVNHWDYPVQGHSYEEWEDEFREVMKAADMPLEKE